MTLINTYKMDSTDNHQDRAAELLAKIREYLVKEDQLEVSVKPEPEELIKKYALPSLNNVKDILGSLYAPFYLDDQDFSRKIKNKMIRKIANISRNTIELPLMRQQKFNDNIVLLLEYLFEENLKLRAKLQKDSHKN